MAQLWDGAVLTDEGKALLAKAQTGEADIQFTRLCIGSGTYTDKSVETLETMTDLKEPQNNYEFTTVKVTDDVTVDLTAVITNEQPLISKGFYLNEMGIFADGGDGEVLYAIVVTAGDQGDYMPAYTGEYPTQIVQDFYITVANAANVTVYASEAAYALEVDLETLQTAVNDMVVRTGFTIRVSDWVLGDSGYVAEITDAAISDDQVPFLFPDADSVDIAIVAGMSQSAETGDGYYRVYSQSVPGASIKGEMLLVKEANVDIGTSGGGSSGGGGGGSYTLPTATATRLGGVKIGDRVNVESDGTISAEAATDEEVKEMLDAYELYKLAKQKGETEDGV